MVFVVSSVAEKLFAVVNVGARLTTTLKVFVVFPVLSLALTSMSEKICGPALEGVPTVIFKLLAGPFTTRPELGMVLVSDEVAMTVTAPVPVMESGTSKLELTSMILSLMAAMVGAAVEWLVNIAKRKAELRRVIPRAPILAAGLTGDWTFDRSSEWIMDACRVMRECRTWLENYLLSEEEETRTPGTVGGGVSVVGREAGFGDDGISMAASAG